MKRVFRSVVAGVLEWQVRRLQKKNSYKTIAVVGSIGKTSTKLAVGRALSRISKTRYQEGNYNDRVTIPLVIFGHKNPANVLNIFAWLKIIYANERQLRKPFPVEYVVLELGTDGPGQIKEFSYLQIELAIVTAITPEHMANFTDLDAVASEELSVKNFSKSMLVNLDLCDKKYVDTLDAAYRTYGRSQHADVRIVSDQTFELMVAEQVVYSRVETPLRPKQYALAAVLGVLGFVGVAEPKKIVPLLDTELDVQVPGRLQLLAGKNNSLIIDDTYNASPEAVKLALEVLKEKPGPQKVAILGSMNELGKTSAEEHKAVGEGCKPAEIDLLITIGNDANEFLAPAAEKNGCTVHTFTNPFEAGMFAADNIKEKAVILAKGSQNGVFAEEALKPLLKNNHDQQKLVRQSPKWLAMKRQQFEKVS